MFKYFSSIPLLFAAFYSTYNFFTSSSLTNALTALAIGLIYLTLAGHVFDAAYRKSKKNARRKPPKDKSPIPAPISAWVRTRHYVAVTLVILIAGTLTAAWFAMKHESLLRKAKALHERRERANFYFREFKEIEFRNPNERERLQLQFVKLGGEFKGGLYD